MNISKITNGSIFSVNWAATDRRSVKAYLAGKSDGRSLWWKLNQQIHALVRPAATLELVMHAFHSRHHRLTVAR